MSRVLPTGMAIIGVAIDELVVGRMLELRPLQAADPFRVADEEVADDIAGGG